MELRQLKYFVKIAETLNFSEAAKELFITQGTLSQQIKQLECELDSQLLMRNSHSVSLTEAGEALLPYAKRTIQDAETCFDKMHDLKELLAGTLSIGVTHSFCPILSESLFEFMKQYPKVKLNIVYKTIDELMDKLRHREVDFVLAFKPNYDLDGIESHILFQSNLSVIVNENHSLANERKITLEQLQKFDIALPTRGLQARNAIERSVDGELSRLRVHIELNDANILLQLVRQSNLVTLLAETTISSKQGLKAIPLDLKGTEMIGCVHLLEDAYRKRSMSEFIRILSDSVAVRQRANSWI